MNNKIELKSGLALMILFLSGVFMEPLFSQENKKPEIKTLVLKGARIEGQMGPIKALIVTSERRPDFSPMALQLAQKDIEIRNINHKIVERKQYQEPFPVTLPK